ncbi:MAG: carbohydrate-binding protein [Cytophagales bacterium]
MKSKHLLVFFTLLSFLQVFAQRKLEYLDRGLVAVKVSNGVFLSWRILGTEPKTISFNVYRNGTKINSTPITGATNMTDASGTLTSTYTVKPIINNVEGAADAPSKVWARQVKAFPVSAPPVNSLPDGSTYTYEIADGSTGDLDGDGKLDIVFIWNPTNMRDNSLRGYTGNVWMDGYTLEGKRLFRLDLGKNIRAGCHYSQFVVADFDVDGKAEIMVKTAPGTKDATGNYLSKGPAASDDDSKDYRTTSGKSTGYILSGPEYLTVFRGYDGKELATENYIPVRGTVSGWGDSYGNRVDRFLATAAWLDGVKPSGVFQRGYYTRMAITAWDWNGSALTMKWAYDAKTSGVEGYGQGNHNLAVGDVDGDGKDEIIQGACAIDHDGKFMYRTGLGHGDAMHMGDFDPDRAGLEVYEVHEETSAKYGYELHDAKTGKIYWGYNTGFDNGRGICADVDSTKKGFESWSFGSGVMQDVNGNNLTASRGMINFRVYWDGDILDEALEYERIEKLVNGKWNKIFYLSDYGVRANNGNKYTPCVSADLLGDWREEIVMGSTKMDSIKIFTTIIPTKHKLYTLMHDPTYRCAISFQNTAYNQPPHLGFYIGNGTTNAPTPNISLVGAKDCNGENGGKAYIDGCGTCVGGSTGKTACVKDCNGDVSGTATLDSCGVCVGGKTGLTACTGSLQAEDFCSATGVEESSNLGFEGDGYLNSTNSVGSGASWYLVSDVVQTAKIGIRYANGGTAARGYDILVNDAKQTSATGAVTGAWATWKVEYVSLTLKKGVNKLQISSLTAEGAANIDAFVFNTNTIKASTCFTDCNGVVGGTAYLDACNICVGGTTGKTPCVKDCNGDINGAAYLDTCGVCVGGKSPYKTCVGSMQAEEACKVDGTLLESKNAGYQGAGYVNTNNLAGASISWKINSNIDQSATIVFRYSNGGTASRDGIVSVNGSFVDSLSFPNTDNWTTWTTVPVLVNLKQGSNEVILSASGVDGLANIDALYLSSDLGQGSCLVTSLDEQSDVNNLLVFPNPFKDELNIYSKDGFEFEIWDAQGQIIQNGLGEAGQYKIQTDLSTGIYLLKVQIGDQVIMKKIVRD